MHSSVVFINEVNSLFFLNLLESDLRDVRFVQSHLFLSTEPHPPTDTSQINNQHLFR